MLVVFSSDIENVSADLSSAQLVDLTSYVNQGVARNTLAVYVFLYKRAADNTDTPITISNTSPLTATYWTFSLPDQDGVFVAQVFGIPIWSAGTYSQNQCVYYSGSVYYVNASSTSQIPGGSDWTLIPTANMPTVIPALSPPASNVSQTQTYNFCAPHVATGQLGDALADFGLLVKNGRPKNWNQSAQVLFGAALTDSAWTNFRGSNYSEAQGIIDYLQATTALPI